MSAHEASDKIKKQFSFRKWKLGLGVAFLTGLLTGLGALLVGVTWKQAAFIIAGSVAKDMLLFLKQHPVDSIEDTVILTKKDLNE